MGAYLVDHPGVLTQYSKRTNWSPSRPTGLTVLHTAEGVMDTVGPDTGAEGVAAFIRGRSTPGSYHDIVDSDSGVWLVPYEMGAWQDGTGSNGMAMSISFACRTTDWRRMTAAKRKGFLRQGALAFIRQQAWLRVHGYPATPLRLITKADSSRGAPGFTYHAWRDPTRRTDPGIIPPDVFPIQEFLEECRLALAGEPSPEPDLTRKEVEMLLIRNSKGTINVLGDGFSEWVGTDADNKALQTVLGKPVQLSDDLFDRLSRAVRGTAANTQAIMKDLADEEPV